MNPKERIFLDGPMWTPEQRQKLYEVADRLEREKLSMEELVKSGRYRKLEPGEKFPK